MNHFFTFGVGSPNNGSVIKIENCSSEKARKVMFKEFSDNWGFQYESLDDIHPHDKRFGVLVFDGSYMSY